MSTRLLPLTSCALAALLLSACATKGTGSAAEKNTLSSIVLGADHIGLSVNNLEASKKFFVDALGFRVFNQEDDYPAYFLTNGHTIITLWQVSDVTSHVPFSRKNNVGLHHLAFGVESFEKLDALYLVIKDYPGVVMEFAPELLSGGPSKHMMFREPSGARLEVIHRSP